MNNVANTGAANESNVSDASRIEPLPSLNDDDIEKILQPNDIFTNDRTDGSTTSSTAIEDIINPSLDPQSATSPSTSPSFFGESKKPSTSTHLIRRGTPLGIYQTNLYNQNNRENSNSNNALLSSKLLTHPPVPYGQNPNLLQQHAIYRAQPSSGATNTQTRQATRRYQSHKSRPAFVNKLWSMLNDDSNTKLIQWAPDGKSFIVTNREEFVHEILPKYFKHSNFASFVRQLNMYGWHKVQDVKSGSIQSSSDDKWQFENENFIRGREDLLEKIIRQKGSSNNHSSPGGNGGSISGSNISLDNATGVNNGGSNISNSKNFFNNNNLLQGKTLRLMNEAALGDKNDVTAILGELEQIKYNQIAISKDLLRINKDNELLWKENMMARERHRTQQQALEKMFRFLTSIVPHLDPKMIMDGLGDPKTNNENLNSTNNIGLNHDNTGTIDELKSNESFINDDHNPYISATANARKKMGIKNDGKNINPGSANSINRNKNVDESIKNNNDILNDIIFNTNLANNLANYNSSNGAGSPVRPYKQRYLLKNRANSSTSNETPDSAQFNIESNSDGKISEIPFDDEDEDTHFKNFTARNPNPQAHENAFDPSRFTMLSDGDLKNDTHTDDTKHNESDLFLDNVHRHIDEQDARLQNLENIVHILSPGYPNKHYNNKISATHSKLNMENTSSVSSPGFNLQDYLTGESNSPNSVHSVPSNGSGSTPLPMPNDNDNEHASISPNPGEHRTGLTPYLTVDDHTLTDHGSEGNTSIPPNMKFAAVDSTQSTDTIPTFGAHSYPIQTATAPENAKKRYVEEIPEPAIVEIQDPADYNDERQTKRPKK
ncbi:hsf1p [Saccharomyces arboricola H-6]|uniref:Heat shock transcription factor n=1 Tax=Saccharomyces arboricola (strain H-6 / AS 2.3317 / CBS 10644) TaxID=1160507 RepID=J8Q551_SACAR|nr:hsf1p [Saccharomyces arboricola H-6]